MQYLSSPHWIRRSAAQFVIVILALLLMASLAACGGGGSSSSGSGGTASSGPVNLTFWSWVAGIDKSVALFNQSHPNIHVTLANVGSGPAEYDKLYTAIKANNEPDLGQVEFQLLPTFETTGALIDLTQYGASSVANQFVPWTWKQVSLGNAVYAIPQDSGPMALFYRQDIFNKYHLPVPTTWAQYADDAAKLHAADPKEYITDFPPKQPGWFTGLVWQAGGQLFGINGQSWKVSINNSQAQQVASYWQDLINKKLVKTDPDFVNSWYHDLQTGAIASWISGVWGVGTLLSNAPQSAGKWRVAPTPQWQAGQSVDGNWGGSTTAVFKSTKHPKEAAEFAVWLNTNQQSLDEMIKNQGIYPAYQPALDSPSLSNPQPFFGNQTVGPVFKDASAHVNVNFQWGPTINQVYTDIGNNFANAINGQGTLSDALNATQQSTITFMQKQGFTVSS
ncbi:MAG TPA: sugar ABC transporter substrate-binding protein [Ktedonobacteraceae bacterium]|nr:sugar ABC transporter substrate-binding protein [Ktedonobacteraceae bacterium]